MATESTEPRNKTIVKVALVSIFILACIRFGLIYYFQTWVDTEIRHKMTYSPPQELLKIREQQAKEIHEAPLTIQQAIQKVSQLPRLEWGEQIAPEPSDDMAPMTGWMQKPTVPISPPLGACPCCSKESADMKENHDDVSNKDSNPPQGLSFESGTHSS
ncbi:hypothetical protein [Pajaroellobacter abortibovis]|uniref:Uncharacterized protein n=1 Tax=Pajaroellobacter abortibovis TaxID=1882918 RepID=A0A1L6MVA3_9BACT|nr:hypothetical protein [Pajaroellobacter abortibovis]APR99444.1 hypothetical protein BCY86_01165 [Pajaroellobacter abortibovis]